MEVMVTMTTVTTTGITATTITIMAMASNMGRRLLTEPIRPVVRPV